MRREIKDIEKYSNKWVALNATKTKVIFSADTYKDLLKDLDKSTDKLFLMKLPSFTGSFAP